MCRRRRMCVCVVDEGEEKEKDRSRMNPISGSSDRIYSLVKKKPSKKVFEF